MNPLLQVLREDLSDCKKCSLSEEGRTTVVFGSGCDNHPKLMGIGEGPGAEEDQSGTPFSGPAGRLLDKMLASVGIARDIDTYLANVVMCRPYQNHKPLKREAEICVDHVKLQIALIKPLVLVMIGATATEHVLGVKGPMKNLHGQWFDYLGIPTMPVYHPAYILHLSKDPLAQEEIKRQSWNDLKEIKKRIVLELSSLPIPLHIDPMTSYQTSSPVVSSIKV